MFKPVSAISQVAWVVRDLDAAEAFWAGVRWTRLPGIHFGPDACTYRGQPADFVADISLGYSGELQLELIRPVSGDSIYTEFLAASGPGLHHVCFEVDDMDDAIAQAGLDVVQRGSMAGAMDFAYLDGSAGGAPYVELAVTGPDLRAFFATLKEQKE